jgi:Holliday junction resolvase RusA-like endonuclease
MIFHKIEVKPLSANEAYAPKVVRQGQRTYATSYKTVKYQTYERAVRQRLKHLEFNLGDSGELVLCIRVFYVTAASDIDNCVKPFLDILQRHFGFNDNRVYVLQVKKVVAGKGNAGIEFYLDTMDNYMKHKHYVRPFTPYGAIIERNTTKQFTLNPVPLPDTENREEQLYALDKQSRISGSVGQGVHYILFPDGDIVKNRPDTVQGDLDALQDKYAVYIRVPTPDGTQETMNDAQESSLRQLTDTLDARYGSQPLELKEGFKE